MKKGVANFDYTPRVKNVSNPGKSVSRTNQPIRFFFEKNYPIKNCQILRSSNLRDMIGCGSLWLCGCGWLAGWLGGVDVWGLKTFYRGVLRQLGAGFGGQFSVGLRCIFLGVCGTLCVGFGVHFGVGLGMHFFFCFLYLCFVFFAFVFC